MAHWFHLCLSPVGHIVVPTFKNNLLRNNTFGRLLVSQDYLEPSLRLS
jgi:hypothetical protein